MLIQCPNCDICYQIEKNILPSGGRKFRCAKCGQVWLARPEDAFEAAADVKIYGAQNDQQAASSADSSAAPTSDADMPSAAELHDSEAESSTIDTTQPEADSPQPQPETEAKTTSENTSQSADSPHADTSSAADSPAPDDSTAADASSTPPHDASSPKPQSAAQPAPSEGGLSSDMQAMFSRLNKQNEIIENFDKNSSALQKGMRLVSNALHWRNPLVRGTIVLFFLLFILLSLFSFRYEITRQLPAMENFYTAFGFESVVIGEGLEFNNVNRREYEEDYIRKLEVKGLILNKTEEELTVPTILVELLDKKGDVLQRQTVTAPIDKLSPHNRTSFMFVVTQPSTLTKYIYLTFTREDDASNRKK